MDTIKIVVEVPMVETRTIAGHTLEFDWSKIAEEKRGDVAAWQLRYGFRGVNDAANSQAKSWRDADPKRKDQTWPKADSEVFRDSWLDGSIADKVRRATGGSVADPVMNEARKLAQADICELLGGLTHKEAAAHEKGKMYFRFTEKGAALPNVDKVDEFIKKNDGEAKYMERAKAIVEASNAPKPKGLTL